MKKEWNVYICRAALTFTAATIFTAVFNILNGNMQGDYGFLLELFGFIAILGVIEFILSKFRFRSRARYLAAEFITMYSCYLVFSYFGYWFRFTPGHILLFSFIFVMLFWLLHLYYYFTLRKEADDINGKLEKRNLK